MSDSISFTITGNNTKFIIDNLLQENERLNTEIKTLTRKNIEFQNHADQMRILLDTRDHTIETLKKENEELRNIIKDLTTKIEILTKNNVTLTQDNIEIRNELQYLKNDKLFDKLTMVIQDINERYNIETSTTKYRKILCINRGNRNVLCHNFLDKNTEAFHRYMETCMYKWFSTLTQKDINMFETKYKVSGITSIVKNSLKYTNDTGETLTEDERDIIEYSFVL